MSPKNWFPLILVGIVASTPAHGQFIKAVGFKAGVAISNLHVTDLSRQHESLLFYYANQYEDNLVSPSVSFFAAFLNEQHLGLEADLTYLRKGGGNANPSYGGPTGPFISGLLASATAREEAALQYLELHLALEPKQSVGGVRLYAHIAPTATYLLSAANFVALEELTRLRFGYTLGLGVELGRVFDSLLFLEARYAGDFRPVYETNDGNLWNRSWIVEIGTTL